MVFPLSVIMFTAICEATVTISQLRNQILSYLLRLSTHACGRPGRAEPYPQTDIVRVFPCNICIFLTEVVLFEL